MSKKLLCAILLSTVLPIVSMEQPSFQWELLPAEIKYKIAQIIIENTKPKKSKKLFIILQSTCKYFNHPDFVTHYTNSTVYKIEREKRCITKQLAKLTEKLTELDLKQCIKLLEHLRDMDQLFDHEFSDIDEGYNARAECEATFEMATDSFIKKKKCYEKSINSLKQKLDILDKRVDFFNKLLHKEQCTLPLPIKKSNRKSTRCLLM